MTKDILIYKEYKEYEVIDPVMRSVSVSGINGRVLYLTNDNILKQIDILDTDKFEEPKKKDDIKQRKLRDINLSSKHPL